MSEEDLNSLARLEQAKPGRDLHKFQSAQRLAGVFLSNKDFAHCQRVCLVLERWSSELGDGGEIPPVQLCKVDLWQYLTQLQCLLSMGGTNEAKLLSVSRALLSLILGMGKQLVDPATIKSTGSKFRALIWQAKTSPLALQMFAVELFTALPVEDVDVVMFAKTMPFLLQKLRAGKLYQAETQQAMELASQQLHVKLSFDFALWVFESTKQCDWLCSTAQSEKEILFAAHCCDKQGQSETASEVCVRGLLALPRTDNSPLVSFHVKNLSLQPGKSGVLLLSQRCLDKPELEFYAEMEFGLFAQFRKLVEYIAHHRVGDGELFPLLHARALRMLQDSTKAWEVLQTSPTRDWFLECQLRTDLGLDCSEAAEMLSNARGTEPEVQSWLVLHGHEYGTVYFAAKGSAAATAIAGTQDGGLHATMQRLLGLVDELRITAKPEEEFQTLAKVLSTLQVLGDLYQQQGMSIQARYFYSKALLLANSRNLQNGECQRLQDKLDVLSQLEGKPGPTRPLGEGMENENQVARQHLTNLYLAETQQRVYPNQVPAFLQTCRYECAKILYHQGDYSGCLKMLESANTKGDGVLEIDTLRVRAFLRQEESSVTTKKLAELIRTCVLGGDVLTLVQCYQYLLENSTKLSMEEQAYLVCGSVGMANRFQLSSENGSGLDWHRADTIKLAAKQQRAQVNQLLDNTWTVCTLYYDEQQSTLFLCRTERAREFVVKVEGCMLKDKLEEFQSIMARNAEHLENCTMEFAKSRSQRAKDKWWNDRYELDAELDEWMQRFERECLGWRTVLLRGKPHSNINQVELDAALKQAKFASDWELDLARMCLSSGLNPGVVAKALGELCPSATVEWAQAAALRLSTTAAALSPVLLCLSGALQQIPFESLPCLQLQRVSRIPSLPFALRRAKSCDPSPAKLSLSYVVDPDGTLKRTQEALRDRLEEMREMGICRQGVLGKQPDLTQTFHDFFRQSTLVLYCGHGSGEELVDPRKAEYNGQKWAPAILMGCSSAARKPLGVFEPNGKVVDAYLDKCPLVIGTLWNVSDVDIDRFTLAMLDGLKEGDGDLLRLVAKSRQVCKLRKLVGAAPVCFGVPWLVQ
ncbi:hypothetical protein BASA81_006530 [Batrachochytrium salamandrivorans]|nr:hypothetical protein BASA81_006530 [Batrachochytrium salamandrivorans]